MQMHELRQRIERNSYDVDPRAVADAIVARLIDPDRAQDRRDQPSS
jgi:hypothetical protein